MKRLPKRSGWNTFPELLNWAVVHLSAFIGGREFFF
jgi:hypothetical protein